MAYQEDFVGNIYVINYLVYVNKIKAFWHTLEKKEMSKRRKDNTIDYVAPPDASRE